MNSKLEEILKEIRVNRNSYIISDEEDAENDRSCPSNSENRILRKKHASNTQIDKNKNQDDHFQPSEMSELRQPSTPVGVANETLDDKIIINENRQEADHYTRREQLPALRSMNLNIRTPRASPACKSECKTSYTLSCIFFGRRRNEGDVKQNAFSFRITSLLQLLL